MHKQTKKWKNYNNLGRRKPFIAVTISLIHTVFSLIFSIYGPPRLTNGATGEPCSEAAISSLNRQCARCHVTIGRAELVMKARCFLYHVDCFKCLVCDVPLIKGDLFGMFEAVVYCQTHFRQQQEQQMALGASEDFNMANNGFYGGSFDDPGSSFGVPTPGSGIWPPESPGPDGDYVSSDNNNSISPSGRKKKGRRKRDLSDSEAARSCLSFLDPASGLVEKTKRARTSFKHHQLRIMKSHFQMNQNPDSRELKELATKTGLDKKVLQV